MFVNQTFLLYAGRLTEAITDEVAQRAYKAEQVLAVISHKNGNVDSVQFKIADVPQAEKLEKFIEDVK